MCPGRAEGLPLSSGPVDDLGGACCLRTPGCLCPQEEIRIDATTVFVDPYEEADTQVRGAWLAGRKWLGASCPARGLQSSLCPLFSDC